MRKNNKDNKNKGFTLIELLAVITIMGILMMVAIPAVTRTIENSRRNTFANVAKNYVNAVRDAVLADNLSCKNGATEFLASAAPDGTYYFSLETSGVAGTGYTAADASAAKSQTEDLMESGGKSPFGNTNIHGYVKWIKKTTSVTGGGSKVKTSYSIALVDEGKHGFAEVAEDQVKRLTVNTALTTTVPIKPTDAGAIPCTFNN